MAKKEKVQKKAGTPFKVVSENLPFWPDMKVEHNEPFTGKYENSLMLGDGKPEDQIPVYVFFNVENGEKYFIIQSYAIKKAVEAAKKEYESLQDIVFNFVFEGKTEANGKPFNKFATGYCTEAEWEAYTEGQQ